MSVVMSLDAYRNRVRRNRVVEELRKEDHGDMWALLYLIAESRAVTGQPREPIKEQETTVKRSTRDMIMTLVYCVGVPALAAAMAVYAVCRLGM